MTTAGEKPRVVLTMGDPAGIGPEIIIKALAGEEANRICRPLIVGDLEILEYYRKWLAPDLSLEPVSSPDDTNDRRAVPVFDLYKPGWGQPFFGKASAEGGAASVAYIEKAVELVREGLATAMVTSPINKAAIHLAGSPFPGHTEMLAHLTGAEEYAMMLVGGNLRVSLATIHIPLAKVPGELTEARLLSVIRLTARALEDMGLADPKIAVCGLNPHAGEEGLFGQEEVKTITPAVAKAGGEGARIYGPLPADTVFHRALRGDFQGVVAIYHDQGLIPIKTLYFDQGVNVTLGLPIIRTSVDHGTAYNIAGQGLANPDSLVEAIRLAAQMASRRQACR